MTSAETFVFSGDNAPFEPTSFEDFPESFEQSIAGTYEDYMDMGFKHLFEDPACSCPQRAEDGQGRIFSFRYDAAAKITEELDIAVTEIVVADYDKAGNHIGLGMVTQHRDSDGNTPPFVGWTETFEGFRGHGAGARRLKYMNALSLQNFGVPLRSSLNGLIENEAVRVWQKLVDEGRAEFIDEPNDPHWRFKS